MPSGLDHIADAAAGGLEIFRLSQLHKFPDFVKKGKADESLVVPSSVGVACYADEDNRQFPCHTKASAFLSYLFYTEKQAEFHPKERAKIVAALEKWAKVWNIGRECKAVAEKHAADLAAATLPDSDYAYVWAGQDGRRDRQYPLRSAAEVKAAAEWLHQYRDHFAYDDRRVIATRVLEKAAEFGAAIGEHVDFLERQAGRGVCDPAAVVALIEKRARFVPGHVGVTADASGNPTGGLRNHFLKMAATVREAGRLALQPDMLVKLASTLCALDRQLGLTAKYAEGLERPEDVIFSVTFTKAAADVAAHVPTTSGNVYEKAAFRKLALADVRALFGDEFAGMVGTPLGEVDVEKMAEQVPTLPRPDAQLLENLLSESGIAPVMRKSASAPQGLGSDLMAKIAASYVPVA